MKKFLLTVALIAAPLSVSAQSQNCGPRAAVIERLATPVDGLGDDRQSYGEARQSIALGSNNVVIENWANLETGTWTITGTLSNGLTCLIASGISYELTGGDETPTALGDPT